jgi:hypothetical protein
MDKGSIVSNFEPLGKLVLIDVIDVFVQNAPLYITDIETDWKERDLEQFKKSVNKLKGSVANFYQMDLVFKLRDLELMTDKSSFEKTYSFMVKTLNEVKIFISDIDSLKIELLKNFKISDSLMELNF